jgi:hypothetical protein
MAKFNQETMLKDLIETANNADVTLKEEMKKVVAHFGKVATGKGGLNRSAFRKGAKLETKQKEANRIGLSLEQAESLAYIIEGVNNHRPTLWQTYQIAYFGLHAIKPPKRSIRDHTSWNQSRRPIPARKTRLARPAYPLSPLPPPSHRINPSKKVRVSLQQVRLHPNPPRYTQRPK